MSRHRILYEAAPTSQGPIGPAIHDGRKPMAVGFVDEDGPHDPGGEKKEPVPIEDIADYMADMLQELRRLASRSGMDTLGRVLEIAEKEAKAGGKRNR